MHNPNLITGVKVSGYLTIKAGGWGVILGDFFRKCTETTLSSHT